MLSIIENVLTESLSARLKGHFDLQCQVFTAQGKHVFEWSWLGCEWPHRPQRALPSTRVPGTVEQLSPRPPQGLHGALPPPESAWMALVLCHASLRHSCRQVLERERPFLATCSLADLFQPQPGLPGCRALVRMKCIKGTGSLSEYNRIILKTPTCCCVALMNLFVHHLHRGRQTFPVNGQRPGKARTGAPAGGERCAGGSPLGHAALGHVWGRL